METLRDKTVLITGAARRIGRAITFGLVDAGCGVIAHFHGSESEAQELRQDVFARGGQCWLVHADLGRLTDVENLIEGIERRWPSDRRLNQQCRDLSHRHAQFRFA